jgi:hypothetical protein
MKNTIRNLIAGAGILVLLTHMVSAQWVQIDHTRFNGLSNMACLAPSGGNLFAGNLYSGVFRCADNDTNWTAVNSGLPNHFVWSLVASGGKIFASMYQGGGVFLSANNGATWTAVDSGLPDSADWFLAASGGNLFAAAEGKSVFLSTNSGASWTKATSVIPEVSTTWPYIIMSLVVSGDYILTTTSSGGVYRTTINGTAWTAIDSGLPDSTVWYLGVSGNSVFAGGRHGVYRSSNNGASWTEVNSGLPESTSVMSFAVSGNNIFAGTSQGVFLSTDGGTTWAGCNSGLQIFWGVDGLAVGEKCIYASLAAHHNYEIWRRPLSEIVGIINSKPQQGIVKPYVGGFKINIGKTSIALFLPQILTKGILTVELFTIAGKRIYSATHQAYNGTLNIPVSGLSTGTYLMSIRGNTATLSSPFVVAK